MFLDLIHKNLHISRGEAMAGDAGFDLVSEALQQSLLILIERLGTGMGDFHDRVEWQSASSRVVAEHAEQRLRCGEHLSHAQLTVLTSDVGYQETRG